jgi:hypothetical protein
MPRAASCDISARSTWRWKLVRNLAAGTAGLCDVAEDPLQRNELGWKQPDLADRLRATLAAWRAQQLAYYAFPFYYENYYPPPPPEWGGASADP